MTYSIFESEINVRPDDIDLNNHVHYSKYLDYLLYARYDQMKRCYKMSMEEFIERGYSWFASTANINYKNGLKLNDIAIVRTQVIEIKAAQVNVGFWILRKSDNAVCCFGNVVYTLVSISTGKPCRIPADAVEKYSI
jgi:acyl-CoA thioester hydrolase/thioesterase-3